MVTQGRNYTFDCDFPLLFRGNVDHAAGIRRVREHEIAHFNLKEFPLRSLAPYPRKFPLEIGEMYARSNHPSNPIGKVHGLAASACEQPK